MLGLRVAAGAGKMVGGGGLRGKFSGMFPVQVTSAGFHVKFRSVIGNPETASRRIGRMGVMDSQGRPGLMGLILGAAAEANARPSLRPVVIEKGEGTP